MPTDDKPRKIRLAEDGRRDRPLRKATVMDRETIVPQGELGKIGINYGTLLRRIVGGYEAEEAFNIPDVPIEKLVKMVRVDGQASGLMNLIKLPLIATDFQIKPFDEKSMSERDLIAQNLQYPARQGGMTTDMRYIKADMAMATVTGWRAYEKVFDIRNGFVVMRKLAPRSNDTTRILQDNTGGFAGFIQKDLRTGMDIPIPLNKSLLFTRNKEDNPLYGRSDFSAAYYHYDKMHKLYYIAHIAFQLEALPPRVGKYPRNADQKARDDFFTSIKNLGFDSAMMMAADFEVEAFGTNHPGKDFLGLIEHHRNQMSFSVLASFMDIGRQKGSRGGSMGPTSVFADMWAQAVQVYLKEEDYHFNEFVIPQLVDFNYTSQKYPSMVHAELSGQRKAVLADTYNKLAAAPNYQGSPEFLMSIEEELAHDLELDIDYDTIRAQRIADMERQRKAQEQKANGAVKELAESLKMNPDGSVEPTERTIELIEQLRNERDGAVLKMFDKYGIDLTELVSKMQEDGPHDAPVLPAPGEPKKEKEKAKKNGKKKH